MMPFRWASGRYTCFYCSLVFSESSKLKTHTLTEHGDAKLQSLKQIRNLRFKLDVSSARCNICGEPLKDLNEFLDHLSVKHKRLVFNRKASESFTCFKLSDDILPCLECDEKFRFFGPLLVHCYRNHRENKMYVCEICGIPFIDMSYMLSHTKTVHGKNDSQVKRLVCPKCPKVFRTSYSRCRHLAVDHDVKSAQHVCDECGFMFVYRNRLVRHQLSVHRKEGFKCKSCWFVTFNRETFSRHVARHSEESPFQCEYCSKLFKSKKHLVVHTRIHTNERPYVCQFCDKAFVQVSSLQYHLKKRHPPDEHVSF